MIKALQILFLIGVTNQMLYSQEYNFTVAGHLYGSPESINHAYPAESLLANTTYIKSFNSSFFISLGDNCHNGNDSLSLKIFEESFRNKIEIPVYTAYGNHDGDRQSIEKRIGRKTFYSFEYKNDLFIFLDSELDNNELNNDCLNFSLKILEDAENKSTIKNIFFLSHKLIWATINSKFKIVTNNSNDPKHDYDRYNFFISKIKPVIEKLASKKNVFWMAGDIGVFHSLPLFYDKFNRLNVIATGLGDKPSDLILNIKVNGSSVKISGFNLLTHKSVSIEQYDLAHWEEYFKKSKVFRRKIERLINRYFIIGTSIGIFLTIILGLIIRKLLVLFQ